MPRKTFSEMQCPVARTLDRVGEWWSLLILRDAFQGITRFDGFQKSLDIAPNILTRRLAALVEGGLMERRQYCARPPRHEYVLTPLGEAFRPLVQMLSALGTRHFAPEGAAVDIINSETGARAEPVLVDRVSGRPMSDPVFRAVPGPAADAVTRARFAAGVDGKPAPDGSA